jgi:two-component system, cell cycle sensor histidine kinase and response regulator CckA
MKAAWERQLCNELGLSHDTRMSCASARRLIKAAQLARGTRNGKRSMNILVIEESRQEMALLRAALSDITSATVRMEHADRLSTALSCLTVGRFDAMLLDLNLPDSAGLDTLARVQARAPALPIVILTGLDDEPLAMRAVQQGAQDYVFKGQYDGSVVHRSLRCAVERNRLVTDREARVAARAAELAVTNPAPQRAWRRPYANAKNGSVPSTMQPRSCTSR